MKKRLIITVVVLFGVFVAGYLLLPIAEQQVQEDTDWLAEDPDHREICGATMITPYLPIFLTVVAAAMVIVITWNVKRGHNQ